MAVYKISNVGAKMCLSISGSNLLGTSLYENRNVIITASSDAAAQKWIIPSLSGEVTIRSYLWRAYGLNRYGSSTINCDVHTVTGNETDATITLYSAAKGYQIKLANYPLYLTASSTTDGATVRWEPISPNNSCQFWSLTELSVIESQATSTIYSIVGNRITGRLSDTQMTTNAKYIYSFLKSKGFTKQAACAILGNFQAESSLNPGIWQSLDNLLSGYGVSQWTPNDAENLDQYEEKLERTFCQWALDVGLIDARTAAALNSVSNSKPQRLMDAELTYLMWTLNVRGGMYNSTASMTLSQFMKSTKSASDLAVIFCDNYLRPSSPDYTSRSDNATKWYNTLS